MLVCLHVHILKCMRACSITKLCSALCNPMDCSPPGFSVMGFSRQEYWSGLPFPPSGDIPDPGIEPASLASPALLVDSLPLSHLGSPYVKVLTCNVMVLGDGAFKSCLGHDNEL